MTTAVLNQIRLRLDTRLRIALACLGLAAFVFAVGAIIILSIQRQSAVAAALPPAVTAQQRELVAATSGNASTAMQAVGSRAEMLNAALPFAKGPVFAAASFQVAGSSVEEQRALLCLTQAVYYEAGFEPMNGRRAVAQVILNRMRHPAYPKSICGVVYQHSTSGICQFTFVCDGSLNRAPSPDAWRRAHEIAAAALGGYVEKEVGSATHYHADYVAPRWAPLLAKISKIGQHIFYRWPGSWGSPSAFRGRYIGEPVSPQALRPRMVAAIARFNSEVTGPAIAAVDGPPVPRAANDVGGLLDTSKGWTLKIPLPGDSASARRLIAEQEGKDAESAQPAAAITVASVTMPHAGR